MRLQSRTRKRIEKKRLLSNGLLLWRSAVLLDWLFPLVRHGLGGGGGFSGEGGREDIK
jgi:hypothetical protein